MSLGFEDASAWSDLWAARWLGAAIQGSLALLLILGLRRLRGNGTCPWLRTWSWRAADLVFLTALFAPFTIRFDPSLPIGREVVVGELDRRPAERPATHGSVESPSDETRARTRWTGSAGNVLSGSLPWMTLLLAVLGVRTLRWGREAWRVHVWLRGGQPCRRAEWLSILDEQGRRLGLGRLPGLVEIEALGSPCVVGILRPRILIPMDWSVRNELVVGAALAHELAHVRRHDLAWALIRSVVDLLLGPLPHLRWRRHQAELDAELECDRLAIHGSGIPRRTYGALLLEVAPRSGGPARHALGVLSIGAMETLERRLRALYSTDPSSGEDDVPPGGGLRSGWTVALTLGALAPLAVPYQPRTDDPSGGIEAWTPPAVEDRPAGSRARWAGEEAVASRGKPILVFRNLGEECVEVRMWPSVEGVAVEVRWTGARPSTETFSLDGIDALEEHDSRAWRLVRASVRATEGNAWLFGEVASLDAPPPNPRKRSYEEVR